MYQNIPKCTKIQKVEANKVGENKVPWIINLSSTGFWQLLMKLRLGGGRELWVAHLHSYIFFVGILTTVTAGLCLILTVTYCYKFFLNSFEILIISCFFLWFSESWNLNSFPNTDSYLLITPTYFRLQGHTICQNLYSFVFICIHLFNSKTNMNTVLGSNKV